MNIFALNECPVISARELCDKHIVKMALETAQILCSVRSKYGQETPYKPTHKNHPCVVWAGEVYDNYLWLCVHGKEICREYTKRYGRIHKCEAIIDDCYINRPVMIDTGKVTHFALAMPDEYKVECQHESYRNYYKYGKAHILKYTNRQIPNWI